MVATASRQEAGAGTPQREWRGGARDDRAWRFHEEWLGYVQPREGLVFSVPVLAEAECHDRQKSTVQAHLDLLCRKAARSEADRAAGLHADREGLRRMADVDALLGQILDYVPEDFDRAEALPAELQLYVPEGPQELRPSFALRRRGVVPEASPAGLVADAGTPASRAGAGYLMLVWKVRDGLPLDKVETETGTWSAAAATKFDRLLRACRVDIGLLSNGDELRLFYAPHGGASGSVTFRMADMVGAGSDARHIVDAFKNLLGAQRFFAVAADRQLPALLRASRDRQADVTKALAEQVLDAMGFLVAGLERAAKHGDGAWLDALLARAKAEGDNTLYEGLLTILLRLVFCLYAEDKGLLPIESEIYEKNYSVHSLFNQLQEDHATHPDTMDRRFGAWPRLLALFRIIHGGASHGDLDIPARHGDVFDPQRFPFLEEAGGRAPAIDDATVYGVLEGLIVLEGQRLSYRALDVEQLGSVYEGLMGFKVERLDGPAICMRGNRVWVVAKDVLLVKPAERASYLEDDIGVERGVIKKIATAIKTASTAAEMLVALEGQQAPRSCGAGKGRLVLQPGLERRRTSLHYTPRELTERVVSRALEPLLAAMGGTPTSERLLDLKICDPAMGSGAFLVAACRFLADHVVAAWTREGKQAEVGSVREDALLRAKRLVAQRCLYGVDKNSEAVNLAKLSLWLETMARDEPFTFVDHALRNGDSLVGLSLAQIRAFDWAPDGSKQLEMPFGPDLDEALGEALHRRQRILDLAQELGTNAVEKKALLRDAEDALDRPRLIGDLLIGAWFSADKDKARNVERLRRKDCILAWLRDGGDAPVDLRALAEAQRARVKPFHWMIEFPEIFCAERRDPLDEDQVNQVAWIDSFVGNPPFMGGSQVSGTFGPPYLDWLLASAVGAHGNADLCAHFFRRCFDLLGENGTSGLVATNTIAQGDTRATALGPIVANGGVLFDAVRSMPWPGSAAVTVAIVHFAKGIEHTVGHLRRQLDGHDVAIINSQLRSGPERGAPVRLIANEGLAYLGNKIYGQGFLLSVNERKELIRKDPSNESRIFPYLGGEEVNTSPTQDFDRYVINFGEMTLEEAGRWPDLLGIVREKVKPDRDRLADNPDGRRRKKYWWHFGRVTPALNAALARKKLCLVTSQVTKHLCFSFQPTNRVLSQRLVAFPTDDYQVFAALQSRVHGIWAWLLSSTLKTDLSYSISDGLETFPFPEETHAMDIGALAEIGKHLYDTRAKLMIERSHGLTVTYNQLKDSANRDPALVALRLLHEEMDRSVLSAYGWSDIAVPPFATATTGAQEAAFERFREANIDHLFVLHARRADAEARTVAVSSNPDVSRRGPKRTPHSIGLAGTRLVSQDTRKPRTAS